MSLIIDVLKKLKTDGKKISIYPALTISHKDKDKSPRKVIIVMLFVGLSAAAGSYFVVQQILSPYATPKFNQLQTQPRPNPSIEPPTLPSSESPARDERSEIDGVTQKDVKDTPELPPTAKEIEQAKTSNTEKNDISAKLTFDIKLAKGMQMERSSHPIPDLEPTALALLAQEFFKRGDYKRSAMYYEGVLSIKEDPKVINNLLIVYTRMKEFARAEDLINRYKDEKLVYTYILELVNTGESKYAERVSEKLLKHDKNGLIHFARAILFERIGDYKRALGEYEEAYKKNSHDPYLLYNYARLLEATGRLREAFNLYSRLRTYNLNSDMKRVVDNRVKLFKRWGFR